VAKRPQKKAATQRIVFCKKKNFEQTKDNKQKRVASERVPQKRLSQKRACSGARI